MPRKDVPYPAGRGVICAIKEELRALWARAGNCINKINNITPDGDGKFEINAGTGIIVSPDGNGIEISAASVSYTGVDPIVVDNDTLEISAPTVATQDDLAAKADKATTLAGYGITDGVTTNTAQDITASKNFDADQFLRSAQGSVRDLRFIDKTNNVRCGMLRANPTSANNQILLIPFQPGSDAFSPSNGLVLNNNGSNKYATVPYRPYNSSNVNDVQTIGAVAANPSIIHAIGNETKSGTLTIPQINFGTSSTYVDGPTGGSMNRLRLITQNNTAAIRVSLELRVNDAGTATLVFRKFNATSGQQIGSDTIIATL